MTPQRFFDVAIPQLAKEHASLFAALSGTLAFIVRDIGTWTVQLGNTDAPVIEGAKADADLVLSFEASAFDAFIDGSLDLQDALNKAQIAHDGDLAVLTRFSRLLQSPASLIDTRSR